VPRPPCANSRVGSRPAHTRARRLNARSRKPGRRAGAGGGGSFLVSGRETLLARRRPPNLPRSSGLFSGYLPLSRPVTERTRHSENHGSACPEQKSGREKHLAARRRLASVRHAAGAVAVSCIALGVVYADGSSATTAVAHRSRAVRRVFNPLALSVAPRYGNPLPYVHDFWIDQTRVAVDQARTDPRRVRAASPRRQTGPCRRHSLKRASRLLHRNLD
jgi:hypothetical protein